MAYEFRLPDIGEGVAEGEVVQWFVKEGDPIAEDAPLVSVLTDKANVEIPSPKAGRIARLHAQVGEKVKVGGLLVTIDTEGGPPTGAGPVLAPAPAVRAVATPREATPAAPASPIGGGGPTTTEPPPDPRISLSTSPRSGAGDRPSHRAGQRPWWPRHGIRPGHRPGPPPAPRPAAEATPVGPGTQPAPAAVPARNARRTLPTWCSGFPFAESVGRSPIG